MREIKFRAWDYSNDKMYNVENICFNGRKIATLQYAPLIKRFIEDVELMQCTGLKDKNGKEIYEDDILTDGDIYVKVLYSEEDGAYIVVRLDDEEDENNLVDFLLYDDTRIIGNIYENLE